MPTIVNLESHELLEGGEVTNDVEKALAQLDSRLIVKYLTEEQRYTIATLANERTRSLEEDFDPTYTTWPNKAVYDEDDFVIERLGELVGTIDPESPRTIMPAHQEALKYYTCALLEQIRVRGQKSGQDSTTSLVNVIDEAYFASSPSIATYVGGIEGMLEVASYGARSIITQPLTSRVEAELISEAAFARADSLFDAQIMSLESPVTQLELITTSTRLARLASQQGEWAHPFIDKVTNGLKNIAENQEATTPFVRITAVTKAEQLATYTMPNIPQTQLVSELDDAIVDEYGRSLIDRLGNRTDLMDVTSQNDFSLSEKDAVLLRTMYDPALKIAIENVLGIDLSKLSLDAQLKLVTYMIEADGGRFGKIQESLSAYKGDRNLLAEAFLATEFGDDFGDSLLNIASTINVEDVDKTLNSIHRFRENSKHIAAWFQSYDPELTIAYEKAMNERLSDSIAALEELALTGELSIDVSPGRDSTDYISDGRFMINLHSYKEGLEVLHALDKSLGLIHDVIEAEDVVVHNTIDNQDQFAKYRFSSKKYGDALLYVRPEGGLSYDSHLEYGNRKGVEASISFIVNPSDPHHLDIYKDPQGLSIRLDREGRTIDESPFAEDRDPTRVEGSMSLDISSIMGDGRHDSIQVGRFIAAGNILRSQRIGAEISLNHNNNYFNQDRYGSAGGFSKLAIYLMHMAEAMIAVQDKGRHDSPYPSGPHTIGRQVIEKMSSIAA